MKHDKISIVNASGNVMPFYTEKLKRSLLKSGTSEEKAKNIVIQIQENIHQGISTKEICQQAYQLLRGSSRPLAAWYKLKQAIMKLGPTAFHLKNIYCNISSAGL